MDGWKTILSFWGPAYFQGRTVSFRECNPHKFWLAKTFLLFPQEERRSGSNSRPNSTHVEAPPTTTTTGISSSNLTYTHAVTSWLGEHLVFDGLGFILNLNRFFVRRFSSINLLVFFVGHDALLGSRCQAQNRKPIETFHPKVCPTSWVWGGHTLDLNSPAEWVGLAELLMNSIDLGES